LLKVAVPVPPTVVIVAAALAEFGPPEKAEGC